MTTAGMFVTLIVFAIGVSVLFLIERRFSAAEQRVIWLGFVAHVCAALSIVWVTNSVLGGGDLMDYHITGVRLAEAIRADFWGVMPDVIRVFFHERLPLPIPVQGEGGTTGAMVCLTALGCLLLGDSIYPVCMAISLACFFSRLGIFVTFREILRVPDSSLLAVACLLVPSVTFWCSGPLKESFALIGVAMLFGATHALASRRFSIKAMVLMATGLILLGTLKSYLLFPVGFGLAAWFFFSQQRKRVPLRGIWGLIGAIGVIGAVMLIGGAIFPRYALAELSEQALHMQSLGQRSSRGSSIALVDPAMIADGGIRSQLEWMPLALLTALFRPFLFEANSGQMFLNTLETTIFSIYFVIILARNRIAGNLAMLARFPVLGFCVLFVLVAAMGIGITTTNLGSLSRYRAPIMPFFAVLLVMLSQRRLLRNDIRERPLSRLGFRTSPGILR